MHVWEFETSCFKLPIQYNIFLCYLKKDIRIIYVVSLNQKTNIIVGISYAINFCFKFINLNVCVEFTEMWIGINSKNVIEQFSIRQAILWPNDVNDQ